MARKPKMVYRDADGNVVKPPKSAIPAARRNSKPKKELKPDISKKKKTKYKTCCQCHEKLALYKFYSENNPFVSNDGKMNICRDCIRELSVDKDGKLDYQDKAAYIKGRGNTTWTWAWAKKKPFNLIFDEDFIEKKEEEIIPYICKKIEKKIL